MTARILGADESEEAARRMLDASAGEYDPNPDDLYASFREGVSIMAVDDDPTSLLFLGLEPTDGKWYVRYLYGPPRSWLRMALAVRDEFIRRGIEADVVRGRPPRNASPAVRGRVLRRLIDLLNPTRSGEFYETSVDRIRNLRA